MYTCICYGESEVGVELLSILLKHPEIQINKKEKKYGRTALHYACIEGSSKCVKALIDDDRTDVNIITSGGKTPLYCNARYCFLIY